MKALYERCCGIDVHKRIVVACLKCGKKQEIREFGTTTEELRSLTEWLSDSKCQMIAMESTGSYWKPLYNIFELSSLAAIVVNARDMRNVPGRKTDIKDAEWIADLLQHGLLRASYIPNREQRELRELSRYRKSLIEERARELNRLQKMLEGGNIKLASVVSDINGRSAEPADTHAQARYILNQGRSFFLGTWPFASQGRVHHEGAGWIPHTAAKAADAQGCRSH